MTELIFAALFFMALHVGIAGTLIRGRAIKKLGENLYRAVFSLLSIGGILWLIHAYRAADYLETWGQLSWFKPIAAILMPVVFFLVVLGGSDTEPYGCGR